MVTLLTHLDGDFHTTPTHAHRLHLVSFLDRVKCRLLEGVESAEVRAVVLDLQARMLLDHLWKSVEGMMPNPSGLHCTPWESSAENLSQQMGPDGISVDAPLVPAALVMVDSCLDLGSHLFSRLKRYVGFHKGLRQPFHPQGGSGGWGEDGKCMYY